MFSNIDLNIFIINHEINMFSVFLLFIQISDIYFYHSILLSVYFN